MKYKIRFWLRRNALIDSLGRTITLNPFILKISEVFLTIKPEGDILPPWFMGHVYWDFRGNVATYSIIPINYIWRCVIEIQQWWNHLRSKPTRMDWMIREAIEKRMEKL